MRRLIAERSLAAQAVFSAVIVGGATLFVVWNLSPWLWFTDTTPTGGDLGAHVWAPAYLRDELLPDFRLSGWSPDWYAGFPSFTFYMVVPSLLIVMVDVGLSVPLDLLAALGVAVAVFVVAGRFQAEQSLRLTVAGLVGAGSALFGAVADGRVFVTDWLGWSPLEPFTFNDTSVDLAVAAVLAPAAVGALVWSAAAPVRQWRAAVTAAAVAATVLIVPTPYGVAMKLVVIAGIVLLPLSAFFAGRLGGLAFPGPALMALMTLPFIFDRSFNIYGGNLMSTMAGEFAYSLGLSVALLFVGFAARGLAAVVTVSRLRCCWLWPGCCICSRPSSRWWRCSRCWSSGWGDARSAGLRSSVQSRLCCRFLGAAVRLERSLPQRHGLGKGASLRRGAVASGGWSGRSELPGQ